LGFFFLGGGKILSQILGDIKKRFRRKINPEMNSERQ
jgi:hypothetical protein